VLVSYRTRAEVLVIFESPRRVRTTLRNLSEVLGDRDACVARELTKLHEEVQRGTLLELVDSLAESPRGEFTLVIDGCGEDAIAECAEPEAVDREIRALVDSGSRPREIAAELAPRTGLSKRELYARALAMRGDS
jgi:16S rRNA (cytidine1402-2'-O)-methyltransferase